VDERTRMQSWSLTMEGGLERACGRARVVRACAWSTRPFNYMKTPQLKVPSMAV
jgi:hypothetical protein